MQDLTPGWKTSEFWLHMAAIVVPAALGALQGQLNPALLGVLGALGSLLAAKYGDRRADLKEQHLEAQSAIAQAAASLRLPPPSLDTPPPSR